MTTLRGYALNLVLVLSASLVVLSATMFVVLTNSAQTSGDLIARKQAFFATDGMMRSVVKGASDYFRENPNATSAQLASRFDTTFLDSITPAGYTREAFTITTTGRQPGLVPNGAFQGMNASLFPIDSELRLRKSLSFASSRQKMSSTIAQIGMFQFMVFVDGFGDWIPGPPQRVAGRAHANGDFCLASNSEFCLSKVTAAGRLMHAADARCRFVSSAGAPYIARDASPDGTCGDGGSAPTGSEWGHLGASPDRENGCTACDGTAAPWATWARTEFANNALDVDMATPSLKLPITGIPQAQAGKNADNVVASNGANSRFLVDPVLAGDPPDVRAQKYAEKAHIRIVNGVWYLRDPASPAAWPGQPIWSDHPGDFTLSNAAGAQTVEAGLVGNQAIGQSDIRTSVAGRGHPWPGSPPRGFSYYETDHLNNFVMLDDTPAATGVVSYGTLARLPGPPVRWVPGHWGGDAGESDLCAGGDANNAAFRSALDKTGGSPTPVACSGAGIPINAALLNGTRSGFRDGHIQQNGGAFAGAATATGNNMHTKVLPMNFDVAAFRAALADTTPGELGSYFCPVGGACFMGEPFNGIVWIGLTWQGSQNGYGSGTGGSNPALHPPHGRISDGAQPDQRDTTGGGSDNDAADAQLPYPLCTASAALVAPRTSYSTGHSETFKHTSCADYGNELGSRPMAVRVFNGGVVAQDYTGDGALDGLSIVSNVPMYVLGEWNVRTSGGTSIDVSTQVSTPWVPAMVGGDQVYLLSNAFDDAGLVWDRPPPGGGQPAAPTTYNIQIFAGWAESADNQYSGGIENFPRFLEDWNHGGSAQDNTINGSLVVGFNSPYYRWPRAGGPYDPPHRVWSYDPHLDIIANQPPGAPQYNVYATRAWTRR